MTLLRQYRSSESGAMAVEAVFVLPFLLILSFGAIDGSMMLLNNHKMESGLSAAGNYLASSQAPQAFETQAKWLATTGSIKPNGEPRIAGWSDSDVTINYRNIANQGREYRGGDTVQIVELSAVHDFTGIGVIRMFTGGTLTLRATHQERVVGDI